MENIRILPKINKKSSKHQNMRYLPRVPCGAELADPATIVPCPDSLLDLPDPGLVGRRDGDELVKEPVSDREKGLEAERERDDDEEERDPPQLKKVVENLVIAQASDRLEQLVHPREDRQEEVEKAESRHLLVFLNLFFAGTNKSTIKVNW
jgi:hypothetical protein